MGEGREEIWWQHAEEAETDLWEAQAAASNMDAQQLGRIQRKGVWLLVLPSTVNWTALGAQEWRDSLFLCYGFNPPDLPSNCDGFGAAFSICHTMERKKGVLITARHNKFCNGVANLAGKAFTPAHMHNYIKIFTCRAVWGEV